MRPVALITGASSGIGAALAHVFAANGHDLVLVARREAALNEVADTIAAKGHKRPLVLPVDLQQPDAAKLVATALILFDVEPEIVVNNAGFGLIGRADELDRDEQLRMIDLDVRALTDLSLAFSDGSIRHRGGILNVASVAAFLPGPGMAVYYAAKAYVLSFSEALHAELAGKGVRVTALCPGPVPSEFLVRARAKERSYPWLLTQSAEDVAELAYRGLKAGRRLVIPGIGNRLVTALLRFAPRRLVLAGVAWHNLRR